MAISKLAKIKVPAAVGNYQKGRDGYKICKITPHHMAGILTAEQCGKIFQKIGREASSNYGIGNDGTIACYVDEKDRSYASSSYTNDCQAVTIEVSNCEYKGQWKISDAAWNSLVNLCVDICKRNKFRLTYDGTPNGSLTRHNMFAATTCPGPYLQSRFEELAKTVNKILDGEEKPAPVPTPSITTKKKIGDTVTINGIYVASNSTKKLSPARTTGKITKIVNGAANPYLLDNGNLGWTNDSCIVSESSSNANAPVNKGTKMKVNARAGLNVREKPNGRKVGAIAYQTVVIVTEEQNGWSKIGDKQWVSSAYLTKISDQTISTVSFKVGDKVKIKTSATKYVTGQTIPSAYKNKIYTIMQKESGKSLIKELYSWVYDKDLTK